MTHQENIFHRFPHVKSHWVNVKIDQSLKGIATVWCQRFILDCEKPPEDPSLLLLTAGKNMSWSSAIIQTERVGGWQPEHRKEKLPQSCFLVFLFGVFSHVSSPPPPFSPSSLHSPLFILSALCSPVSFSFSHLPFPVQSPFTSSPPLCSASSFSPLLFSSLVPSPSSFESLYPSASVHTVCPLLSCCREPAVRTLSPLSLATVI